MKKLVILLSILFMLASCQGKVENQDKEKNTETEKTTTKDNVAENKTVDLEEYKIEEKDFVNGKELIKDIEKTGDLTEEEKNGLILMREEEKLAYDVYVTLYKKWNKKIFDNISGSEKTHMEAVGDLLVSYNLDDPMEDNDIGVFTSVKLQKLYDDLITKGNKSLLDALIVGITIEDLDIYDLDELSSKTTKKDILAVYDNLNRGSRNHMRAFYKNIIKQGGNYKVQYISPEKYLQIISSKQEKGK